MVNYMLKEINDESLQLRKLLQKYKIDIKQSNLSQEQSLSAIENMIKISTIIYAKINYLNKL
tara:strand:+ start:286 stop:471 length:186 start_codon:yes stop_codon:yes gene_type:complete